MIKYLSTGDGWNPQAQRMEAYDYFTFTCRWCEWHGLVGAPHRAADRTDWPWQCPACARKYHYWRPRNRPTAAPRLTPMDLYGPGRPKRVPRDEFKGYVPPGTPYPRHPQ